MWTRRAASGPSGHEGLLRISGFSGQAGGLLVGELAPASPLDRGGLRAGDAILAVNNYPTEADALAAVQAG